MSRFLVYIIVLVFVFNYDVYAKDFDMGNKAVFQKNISAAYMVDDEIEGDNNYLDGYSDDEELIINYNGNAKNDTDPEPEDPEPEDPEPEDPEPEDLEPEDPEPEDPEPEDPEPEDPSNDNEGTQGSEDEETGTNNSSSESTEKPINVTVNTELNRDDINTINEKLDKIADLIYKLTISLWALFGLLLGTKMLRGIFNG